MKRFWYLLVLTAMGLSAAAGAQAQQDQSQEKKPHVFTNEDLQTPEEKAAEQNAAATPQSSNADQRSDQDQGDKDQGQSPAAATDPADKRTDAQKAEDELKKWKKEKSDLQRKLERVQGQAQNETDPFRKQMYLDAYNNQQTTLQEYDQKIDAAQKQYAEAKAKEQEQGDQSPQGQEQPKQDQQETPPQ